MLSQTDQDVLKKIFRRNFSKDLQRQIESIINDVYREFDDLRVYKELVTEAEVRLLNGTGSSGKVQVQAEIKEFKQKVGEIEAVLFEKPSAAG